MKPFVTDTVKYIGCDDKTLDLFESQYIIPNGIAYNSYVILDDEIAIMDTVDKRKTDEWLSNLEEALEGRKPTYLVIHHMEPDHAGSIQACMEKYPEITLVGNKKIFEFLKQFTGIDVMDKGFIMSEGNVLNLGSHELKFFMAPMVHWPEVMVSYDSKDKILFSADGFGKFGALDCDEDWACEARRYYFNIVGKYGAQVQALLKKASTLDIEIICPTHGPILKENLGYYLDLYNTWSSYKPESDGIFVAYCSIHGNTANAIMEFEKILKSKTDKKVVLTDLARCDLAEAVEDAFRYSTMVVAAPSYDAGVFPIMNDFLHHLKVKAYQNRKVGIIENGTWAPSAGKVMNEYLTSMKDIEICPTMVSIRSSANEDTYKAMDHLADELLTEHIFEKESMFSVGYGLYVLTTKDGTKDNGCIINTVQQVTSEPNRISVTVNKQNYSTSIVSKTGVFNISVLTEETPFSLFQNFGFQSGKDVDKFKDYTNVKRGANGVRYLEEYTNTYLSGKVVQQLDLGSHIMFIADVTDGVKLSDKPTVTYDYYQKNIKPKAKKPKESAGDIWVCKICGWTYDESKGMPEQGIPAGTKFEDLPEDFFCPLCKHPKSDFEKM